MVMIKHGMVVLATLAVGGCGQPAVNTGPAPAEPVATNAPAASVPIQAVADRAAGIGVTFDPGPGLTTAPCEGDMPRCIVVSDPSAEPFMRELLTVQVQDKGLEAVAADDLGYMRNAEGRLMTTYGRFEPGPVESFTVNGNAALRATTTCGISEPDTGFHAAAGECISAVISDGTRSVVVDSSGYGNAIDATNATIASIRFSPHP
jgi:hypothetical protein